MQHSRRSPSADNSRLRWDYANGPPDNNVRITMTIPTQIQNQPLVSHMSFQINTRQSFAASATARRVVATIQELQPIGGRRGVPFRSEVIRLSQVCLVVLSRPGSNFDHACCAQLLQPQQSRVQVTHAAYTTSRGFARPADASVSHTTMNVIPYSTKALWTSRA